MQPAGEGTGSSLPLRRRRFRRDLRFVPATVRRVVAHATSSSRTLHAPSETPIRTRPAPPGVEHLPWGSRALFATSASGIVTAGSHTHRLPSSAFLTPARVCSASGLAGLFHPAAAFRVLPREAPTHTGQTPRRRLVALSSFGDRSLPPVARRLHVQTPRPQGFALCESSGTKATVFSRRLSPPPRGSILLQVLSLVDVTAPSRRFRSWPSRKVRRSRPLR
jgi:hypothetical protein